MKVREAMTGDVRLTAPDRTIREAAEMMANQDIGATCPAARTIVSSA